MTLLNMWYGLVSTRDRFNAFPNRKNSAVKGCNPLDGENFLQLELAFFFFLETNGSFISEKIIAFLSFEPKRNYIQDSETLREANTSGCGRALKSSKCNSKMNSV